MHYVYILRSKKDDKLYIGYTRDLKSRFAEHQRGLVTSTRHRAPLELIYYEGYRSQADAEAREQRLKSSAGASTALKRRLSNSLRQERLV